LTFSFLLCYAIKRRVGDFLPKAGLSAESVATDSADDWKSDADFMVFEAIVFGEKKYKNN